jgi:hypothetical protein
MNRDWMRERMESFIALGEEYDELFIRTVSHARSGNTRLRTLNYKICVRLPTVREIVKRLDPALARKVEEPNVLSGASDSVRAVHQALGILWDQDQLATILAPDAPSLVADQFHPYIWAAASALWDTSKYRVRKLSTCMRHRRQRITGQPPLSSRAG